jgi:uroporphyrinogen decarboxylase
VAERHPSEKPLLDALQGKAASVPPIWLMRQAGRYLPEYRAIRAKAAGFLDLCYAPDLATTVTLQPVRRFGLDAAILFSDILVVPHGLGAAVAFREGEGPVLQPIRSVAALAGLSLAGMRERLAAVYQTVRQVKDELPARVALIGFAGSPWTLATYLVEGGTSRDFRQVREWALGDQEGFAALIDLLTEATIEHLSAQAEAGAEAVQLFDSWAGILPESGFRRWVIEPTRRIVEALKQRCPGLPVIGFPRGAGLLYRDYFVETGVTALGLDQTVPLAFGRDVLQRIGPVQGNLDPVLLVLGGAPMTVAAQAVREAWSSGAFIFNLGHGILPETPPEHVARLIELVRR